MDIKTTVRCPETGNEWDEIYRDVHTCDPVQHAKDVLENWNNTLRPHDKPREFVSATVIDDANAKPHEWGKVNMITIMKPRPHDKHKCKNCNVTGKTFRLGSDVLRDKRYSANKWQFCQG